MAVYYNEFDRQKAAWLRELIAAGCIARGDVDERSIHDVRPDDLAGYTQCHWFAGIGIWSYALRLAEWPDDRPVWTGSCPCPSFSAAGKGQGFDDPRHLWPNWFGLIGERLPPVCFGEQVDDAIGHGWLDLVQTDLESKAYAVGKAVLGACSVGAPHIRQRLYFCADTARAQRARFKGEREHVFGESGAGGSSYPSDARCNDAGQHGSGRALLPARSEQCGDALGSPESLHSERRPLLFNRPDGRDRADGGRQEAHGIAGACGEVRERSDADGREPDNREPQRGGQQRLLAEDRGTGDPCDTSGEGLPDSESQVLRGARRREEGRAASESGEASCERGNSPERGQPMCGSPSGIARHAALTGTTRGFWRDCDWWYGKDGKYRPIERGLLPLAHGSAARVLRLRGYGDGIVAQAAAAFIRAYMDLNSQSVGSEARKQ